mmetsp:Transcript_18092/g.30205  ORF Transcript_18092/g.30205 Transcript_18092/m.30205 type:complete len:258 (-) Transcript_18092:342-1115(-)|eukprot:CAMPEP_0119315908 /NCGR_PEP_ID=MMETSP1333-20130426/37714_1 /TAXON_ID=418940 /ORGANISM="Scyphosphaera apsteinii, Strain RCC1455" /LENGTH=257 /DNA_ID=CAMNT_0007321407 /DNA_START=22 /DNA_END=795 /DNA_ORIENTATION=+
MTTASCPYGDGGSKTTTAHVDADGSTTAIVKTSCAVSHGTSGCPMNGKSLSTATANAFGASINPANAMPPPNQQPGAAQRLPLSTERIASTIPSPQGEDNTSNSTGTWIYPSPQMFYNAMQRKGFSPKEEEMRTVVAIHNTVNERTWQQILEWESQYPECLAELQLVRFSGKPDEPTWKARWYNFLGYKAPFDRHDWVVKRCGKEVRYLIDFYQGKPTPSKPVAMHIDARPAADDFSGVWQRLRMPFTRLARGGRDA